MEAKVAELTAALHSATTSGTAAAEEHASLVSTQAETVQQLATVRAEAASAAERAVAAETRVAALEDEVTSLTRKCQEQDVSLETLLGKEAEASRTVLALQVSLTSAKEEQQTASAAHASTVTTLQDSHRDMETALQTQLHAALAKCDATQADLTAATAAAEQQQSALAVVEKESAERVATLTSTLSQRAEEMTRLQAELDESVSKTSAFVTALSTAQKQIAGRNDDMATMEAMVAAKEEQMQSVRDELDALHTNYVNDKTALIDQVATLEASLKQVELDRQVRLWIFPHMDRVEIA